MRVLQYGPLPFRGSVAFERIHRVHEPVQMDASREQHRKEGEPDGGQDRAQGQPAAQQKPKPFRQADDHANEGQTHQHIAYILPFPGHLGRRERGEHGKRREKGLHEAHTLSPFKQRGIPATSS